MVNRDDLIAYLLHEMPDDQRLDFAEQWFTNPGLSEQLSMAEAELFDSYVRNELRARQRALFERYLLKGDSDHRKLGFAAALRGVFPPRQRRRVPWLAMTAAALLVALGGGMLRFGLENRALHRQIAALHENAQPAEGGVYSASLVAGELRGAAVARSVALPPNARMLRLDLDLSDVEKHEAYAATLYGSGGRMWREEPVRSESRGQVSFATVWIPADILAPGKYRVTLEFDGNPLVDYQVNIARRIQ
jgi:hypothetical protein